MESRVSPDDRNPQLNPRGSSFEKHKRSTALPPNKNGAARGNHLEQAA
jgi:hypothetical protein